MSDHAAPNRPGPMPNEYVEPVGNRILVRKDESRGQTRGGIVLPSDAEIPTITGRVVEISAMVERDADFPVRKYDKVLYHPKRSIPVDLEADNRLFVVPIADVCAVFRRSAEPVGSGEAEIASEQEEPPPPRRDPRGGEAAGAA